jgi:hypothetical protein
MEIVRLSGQYAIMPFLAQPLFNRRLPVIYEMRTYTVRVGELVRYVKQFEEKGLPIVSRYCKLVGYWTVDSGELNRVVHIWEFEDLEQRRRARELWWADPQWLTEYLPLALPLVLRQESMFMSPAGFSPIR